MRSGLSSSTDRPKPELLVAVRVKWNSCLKSKGGSGQDEGQHRKAWRIACQTECIERVLIEASGVTAERQWKSASSVYKLRSDRRLLSDLGGNEDRDCRTAIEAVPAQGIARAVSETEGQIRRAAVSSERRHHQLSWLWTGHVGWTMVADRQAQLDQQTWN